MAEARATLAELHRVAAAYPPEAALTLADERERFFTDLQRAAWELRFGSSRTGSEAHHAAR